MGNNSEKAMQALDAVTTLNKYFASNPIYRERVGAINELYQQEEYDTALSLFAKFPDARHLMGNLIKKLKQKSVYHTLKRIVGGKCDSPYEALKGLYSLSTHCCIEIEHGATEYHIVLTEIFNRIGSLIYGGDYGLRKDRAVQ